MTFAAGTTVEILLHDSHRWIAAEIVAVKAVDPYVRIFHPDMTWYEVRSVRTGFTYSIDSHHVRKPRKD